MRAVIGVPFSVTLQAVGGTGALTWSVTAGQLPPGLGLGSSTGLISGTPTSGWGSPFVIQVADAKTTVAKQFYFNLYTKLSLDPVTPPSAHLNAPYALSLSVELGGSGIAFWKISAGQLPPGIQLNYNLISGTPTQAGTFSFTVQIQDYTMPQTATEDFTIVVDTHLAITKWNLQGGGQNQPYTDAFTAVNGVPPYTWSATGLPSGLNLNASTGQLTGTPATFGSFNYTVTATDSSVPLQSDTQQGSKFAAAIANLRNIGRGTAQSVLLPGVECSRWLATLHVDYNERPASSRNNPDWPGRGMVKRGCHATRNLQFRAAGEGFQLTRLHREPGN